jgi:hypothetical protein
MKFPVTLALLLVMGLLNLVALLGADEVATPVAAGANAAKAQNGGADSAAAPAPTDAAAEAPAPAQNPGEKPGEVPAFDAQALRRGDLAIELSVTPECGIHDQPMQAHLKTVTGAYVSIVVAYSDGQSYGTMYAGPVAPDGSLAFPWTIPPQAAAGQGWVMAAGHDPATEESGTTGAIFRVGGTDGC